MKIIQIKTDALTQPEISKLFKKLNVKKSSFVFAAFKNNLITGIACLYQNEVHTNRDYIAVYVKEKYRREGIGLELLHKLQSVSEKKKYQCMCDSSNTALILFLQKNGFSLARRCYNFSYKYIGKPLLNFYGTIKELNNISIDEEKELARLIFKNYSLFHKKINTLSTSINDEIFYNKLIKPYNKNLSTMLLLHGKPSAYMIVYGEDENTEIGYIGGKYKKDINIYLNYFLNRINSLSFNTEGLMFEIDDTDFYAFPLIKAMNVTVRNSYNTYIAE